MLSGGPLEIQKYEARPLGLLVLAASIFIAGYLTLFLPRAPDQFTPIGLVDAVLVAVLLLCRQARWPWVLATAAVGELGVGVVMSAPLDLALAMTACSLLACTLTALLVLRALGSSPDMSRVANVVRYLGIVAGTAVAGALLASSVRSAIAGAPLLPNIFVWATRDFTGLATLTPCLVVLAAQPRHLRHLVGPQAWTLLVLILVEMAAFFLDPMPLTYAIVAALLLVTWRLRIVGAAAGILLTYAFAVPATLWGRGPFAAFDTPTAQQLLSLQLFVMVAFHMTVPVAAQLARSRRLQWALRDALTSAHESEARHRLIAENMRDLVVQVDRAGTILYASPSARRLGYAPEEMVGRKAADFVHPDNLSRFLENTAHVMRGAPSGIDDHRFRVRLKDGRYRWVEGSPSRLTDPAGVATGLVSVVRDIDDQRQAAEALATSEARYRLLADKMNDIVACYRPGGVIAFCTGATDRVLGYRPYELIGRNVAELVHPDDREAAGALFRASREAGPGAPPFRAECRIAHKDGSWVWLQANPRAVYDEAGELLEWQDVVRDITAGKALEDELRAARARADAAARSNADFLADMGHEVRGPLNSVIGFARMARAQRDRIDWCMDCIEEAARSLLTMVGDILDFSRLEAAQVRFRAEPLRLSEFLRGTIAQLEPQARAKTLKMGLIDRTDGARIIATDANRLRQVLINLLGNAVKFTHDGEVVLEASYDEARERLAVEVRDTGPGVPADQLSDLFERFSPAHPSGGHGPGGVGLGLAISKSIVEGLGGEIGVESEPGRGSVFRFWIPAPAAQEVGPVEAATPGAPALRILVATAEAGLQGKVARSLARRAEVLPADDLAAATRLAAQEPLDLIIVDLSLARGASTLRRLRKASGPNSRTPALAFAQETGDELYARAAGQGFQGLLAKSSSDVELISGVAEALVSSDLWNRPAPLVPRARRRTAAERPTAAP